MSFRYVFRVKVFVMEVCRVDFYFWSLYKVVCSFYLYQVYRDYDNNNDNKGKNLEQ